MVIRLTRKDWEAIGPKPYIGPLFQTPDGRRCPTAIVAARRGWKPDGMGVTHSDLVLYTAGRALAARLGWASMAQFWADQVDNPRLVRRRIRKAWKEETGGE